MSNPPQIISKEFAEKDSPSTQKTFRCNPLAAPKLRRPKVSIEDNDVIEINHCINVSSETDGSKLIPKRGRRRRGPKAPIADNNVIIIEVSNEAEFSASPAPSDNLYSELKQISHELDSKRKAIEIENLTDVQSDAESEDSLYSDKNPGHVTETKKEPPQDNVSEPRVIIDFNPDIDLASTDNKTSVPKNSFSKFKSADKSCRSPTSQKISSAAVFKEEDVQMPIISPTLDTKPSEYF